MIAAAEVGAAPLPALLQAYEAHWLWFAVWGDSFINNADWNSLATLTTVSAVPGTAIECLKLTAARSITATMYLLSTRSRAGGGRKCWMRTNAGTFECCG